MLNPKSLTERFLFLLREKLQNRGFPLIFFAFDQNSSLDAQCFRKRLDIFQFVLGNVGELLSICRFP
jgi:hypothetical protein